MHMYKLWPLPIETKTMTLGAKLEELRPVCMNVSTVRIKLLVVFLLCQPWPFRARAIGQSLQLMGDDTSTSL